ncbi:MAG: TetR/AcrR family transcriptional regulator [Deltaproteobacteria bacterium]|nr:TetR/AcrR family transcriptional regulator [Deltaproteobacteria bacterium]
MKKKEAILNSATRLFSEKGFKDTSISEISRATGAAEGTIFYHFKSKEELFLAILKEFKDSIVDEFKHYIEEKDFENGMEMVDNVISFYLYLAGSMEDRFLLLHRHDAYELSKVNPICREYLEEIYNCLVELFERAIILGREDGSIEKDIHPRKTGMIIFAMVDAVVRFNTYSLYDAGALYSELINACHRILADRKI